MPIKRGENGGRTLPHKNVVKELVKLGAWSGQARAFTLPSASAATLKTAILVQAGPGGADPRRRQSLNPDISARARGRSPPPLTGAPRAAAPARP